MSVPYQVVEAPIGPGLDEKTHPAKVDLGKLIGGENFVFNKNGSLSKRFGSEAVSSDILPSGAIRQIELLSNRENELVANNNKYLYSRLLDYDKWILRGELPECIGFTEPIVSNMKGPGEPSIAYWPGNSANSNGVFVISYVATTGSLGVADEVHVYSLIIDATTYATILGPIRHTSASEFFRTTRVCVVGDYAVIAYANAATTSVIAHNINLNTPTAWSAATVLVNDLRIGLFTFGRAFDIQPIANNTTEFAFVYEQDVAAPRIRLHKFNATTLTSTLTTLLASLHTVLDSLAITSTQNELTWVAYTYSGSGDVVVASVNTNTFAAVTAPTVVSTSGGYMLGLCRRTSTSVQLVYTTGDGTGANSLLYAFVINSAGAAVNQRQAFHAMVGSRPFLYNGECYVFAYITLNPPNLGDFQTSFVLLSLRSFESYTLESCKPICNISNFTSFIDGAATDILVRYTYAPSNIVQDKHGLFHTIHIGGFFNKVSSKLFFEDAYVEFDTQDRLYGEINKLSYYTGGLPYCYDGHKTTEVSFLHTPIMFDLVAGVGGALTLNSNYSYVVNYFYVDSRGNRHRSSTSVPVNFAVGGANNQITFKIKTINLTQKQNINFNNDNPIGIEIWRTVANGTLYRRIYEVLLPATLINSVTAAFVTHTDTVSDATIADNEILYTTGGFLASTKIPSAQCMTVHKRRLWFGSQKTLWYSHTQVDGEACSFNPEITFFLEEGGNITALASLDDKLIIFKDDRIFVVYGDGPTDKGSQSDFTDPQKISSNVGCINPRSVVFSPLGLFFQSKKGIYILTRSMDIQFVGQSVEDVLQTYSVVNSAVLHPEDTEVRFICSQPNQGLSVELRFDFRINQWSVSTYKDHRTGINFHISSTVNNQGRYVWTNTEQISYEDRTTYLDSGAYVSMLLEFAPLSVQGTQGYQSVSQVLLNCERKSPHDMTVQLNMDTGAYVQTKQWANTELAALPKEQLEVHVGKVKNQSLVVRMVDTEPAILVPSLDSGEGYSMIGLTYRVGPNDGPQKLIQGARK